MSLIRFVGLCNGIVHARCQACSVPFKKAMDTRLIPGAEPAQMVVAFYAPTDTGT